MRFYSTTYFIDKKLNAHIRLDLNEDFCPITVTLSNSQYDRLDPSISFHMSERQFINFKNSVIATYETYLRAKKEHLNG